jgi:hypothetical protein
MSAIKPIETRYHGYRFRSRLEARWAVFFDEMGIQWEYEPQGFVITNGVCYLPDFHLPELRVWVEIKPNHDIPYSDCQKVARFAYEKSEPCLLIVGTPGKQKMYLLDEHFDPTYLCTTDDELFQAEFTSEDDAKSQFFNFSEDYCLVNFGVVPLSERRANVPWIWQIVFECQPVHVDRNRFEAANKARSARFEFGESGGVA